MTFAYREHVTGLSPVAAAYDQLEVRPLTGGLGAELFGVDLSVDQPVATIAEIRRALLEFQVIFFRDQILTPEQHRDFGQRFGELHLHEYVRGLDEVPEVMPVIKLEGDRFNFGGTWHTDVSYHETPPLGSILYALDVPDVGGDTLFANQYLACETLPEGYRDMLQGRTAIHSSERIYGRTGAYDARYRPGTGMPIRDDDPEIIENEHPIFRTHPETGHKALYVNGNFVVRIAGLSEADSAPILQRLYQHATVPDFCCRFRWRKGSVAFWDNRCVQHYAVNDYPGQRRIMHRVTVMGDKPF